MIKRMNFCQLFPRVFPCLLSLFFLHLFFFLSLFSVEAGVIHANNPRPKNVKNFKGTLFKGIIYYVSPSGADDGNGTLDRPFRTLKRALYSVSPGDIILLREGVYDIDVEVNVSGREGKPIVIESYPGERAIFDGSGYDPSQSVKFRVTGSWLVLRNFEVKNGPSDGVLLTEGASYNVLENLVVHDNYFAGIELENGVHHNLIRNCDSYRNYDYGPSHGEHADGFGVKFGVGPGNRLVGCRAWNNSDDGFDLWEAGSSVTLKRCWAWKNGFDIWNEGKDFQGDGNGFKLGPGSPVVHHCMAWDNARRGFDYNDATDVEYVYNNTSFRNGVYGFQFLHAPHVLKNNLSFMDRGNLIGDNVDDAFNSWNSPLNGTLSASDFVSLDSSTAEGARKEGGGLPETDFLRPSPSSRLIDAGTDVGLFFYGKAPDVGARETVFQLSP